MLSARIAELLKPYLGGQSLTAGDLDRISTYIDILRRWNARINLTAIRDEDEIVTRHFGESLFAARHLFPVANDQRRATNGGISVADVGTGPGFPGIPIKLWAPDIHLTLIESNHKKATFLKEVARALTLTDIDIQITRAETLPAAGYGVVTLRAVERFESILPTAARLVRPSGRLALLIGSAQFDRAESILPAFRWLPPEPVPGSQGRILAIANS